MSGLILYWNDSSEQFCLLYVTVVGLHVHTLLRHCPPWKYPLRKHLKLQTKRKFKKVHPSPPSKTPGVAVKSTVSNCKALSSSTFTRNWSILLNAQIHKSEQDERQQHKSFHLQSRMSSGKLNKLNSQQHILFAAILS